METAYQQMLVDLEDFLQRHTDILMKVGHEDFKAAQARGDAPAEAKIATREDFLYDICVDVIAHCEDKKATL